MSEQGSGSGLAGMPTVVKIILVLMFWPFILGWYAFPHVKRFYTPSVAMVRRRRRFGTALAAMAVGAVAIVANVIQTHYVKHAAVYRDTARCRCVGGLRTSRHTTPGQQ
ncbi:hypothetical protein P9990_25050 (plasmid) [Prescottella equi]|uniref:hypothetical protein n=1 Tax=Rhodococcus hoagii TaxID=43767 RepID=UPI0025756FE6|nr:hypothetical protein [Prescottella equi]WJJ14465.1 hypothetical protein P9990_25050 [Prescottella equi]